MQFKLQCILYKLSIYFFKNIIELIKIQNKSG